MLSHTSTKRLELDQRLHCRLFSSRLSGVEGYKGIGEWEAKWPYFEAVLEYIKAVVDLKDFMLREYCEGQGSGSAWPRGWTIQPSLHSGMHALVICHSIYIYEY